jgi:type I restriction enzyme S subunit
MKICFLVPQLSEQQKIASCISGADDLIEEQTSKTEALRNHKKGLMQQLFPNVNGLEI